MIRINIVINGGRNVGDLLEYQNVSYEHAKTACYSRACRPLGGRNIPELTNIADKRN